MITVPPITDERLAELAARIKPVVQFKGRRHYIAPVDLRGEAYTWAPRLAEEAPPLVTLGEFQTYHAYGYYGMFKPSVAEVLAQVPAEHAAQAVAFEIVVWPETSADLNQYLEALNAGYHVATTRLYARPAES